MRRFMIGLVLVLLLIASIGVGVTVARWPDLKKDFGHAAILHSCVVGRNALVGMNAVVNDNAVIGERAIVAAMAFVKAGMVVPPRSLVAGTPARVVRTVTDQELEWKRSGTESYQQLTRRCLATMRATAPLAAPEPKRHHFQIDEVVPLHVYKERNA